MTFRNLGVFDKYPTNHDENIASQELKKETPNEISYTFWLRNLLSSQNDGISAQIELSSFNLLKKNSQ